MPWVRGRVASYVRRILAKNIQFLLWSVSGLIKRTDLKNNHILITGGSIHVTMTCKEIETIPGSPSTTSRSRLSFKRKNNES